MLRERESVAGSSLLQEERMRQGQSSGCFDRRCFLLTPQVDIRQRDSWCAKHLRTTAQKIESPHCGHCRVTSSEPLRGRPTRLAEWRCGSGGGPAGEAPAW